jgi:hypothetical protein
MPKLRFRRKWLPLLAGLSIIASIAVVGVSLPASAWVVGKNCGQYDVCYYGDIDFQPTSAILGIGQQNVSDWTKITLGANLACTKGKGNGQNWNDCASSINDRMTYYVMCNFEDVGYAGNVFIAEPGVKYANLVNNNFNDEISSNIYTNPASPC